MCVGGEEKTARWAFSGQSPRGLQAFLHRSQKPSVVTVPLSWRHGRFGCTANGCPDVPERGAPSCSEDVFRRSLVLEPGRRGGAGVLHLENLKVSELAR